MTLGRHRCAQPGLPDRRQALVRVLGNGSAAAFAITCRLVQQVRLVHHVISACGSVDAGGCQLQRTS